ncbi:helix-turn-helix transcriptional regulator [Amycolatopsis sp. FDAARGOS 1241]|uniref:helix-turn-helix transcriptional regulator n=1 Tax=Amycolatopsis sp. FDAARGOS 1241 TaxID=2778070 RepID=UPI00194EA8C6|nr:helix-turn-helix transcriptional regulator [Amycolatopsis sp. FDAARGOS 1241]QRP47235.1 helix-turn-helix transcriptional regulator [Amycolatopsis sp. FDAARGOS 1241]
MNRLGEIRKQKVGSQRRLYALLTQKTDELPSWETFKTRLSKWENGHQEPGDFYMPLLCSALGVSKDELGFSAGRRDEPTEESQAQFGHPLASSGALDFLSGEFERYAQVDREHGPQLVTDLVAAQCRTIEGALAFVKGADRDSFLRLGAKYFELAGWLAQDSGQQGRAEESTATALDMAYQIGDMSLVSYIFMRRSNIASEIGKSGEALGLARAALRNESQVGPKTLALALRAESRALALEGDELGAVRAVERALELATENGEPEPQAEYCTPSYVQMERSVTLARLGRPKDAIEPLAAAIDGWPTGSDQRDKGLALARLANIHAVSGDLDGAFVSGQDAVKTVRVAPSFRAAKELQALARRLSIWKNDKRVAVLTDLILDLQS